MLEVIVTLEEDFSLELPGRSALVAIGYCWGCCWLVVVIVAVDLQLTLE